jgi:hypothetical protein
MITTTGLPRLQMDAFWGSVENGSMDASIKKLRGLFIDPTVTDFVLNPESYIFPQEGTIETSQPSIVYEDKIAVLALKKSQIPAFPAGYRLHPLQKDILRKQGFSDNDIDYNEDKLRASRQRGYSNEGLPGTARVWAMAVEHPSGLSIRSQPIFIFNVAEKSKEIELDPPMVMHELAHLAQFLGRVLFANTNHTTNTYEVESCDVQTASVLLDARLPYTACSQYAGEVVRYKRMYIGPDSCEPTPEFMHALAAHDALRHVFK